MIINKYTKHSIFSLPQIFYDTFTKYDLKNSEFVNMYTSDMNNPLLSNHIFLVFHNIKPYQKMFKANQRLHLMAEKMV